MRARRTIWILVLTVLVAGCRDRYPKPALKTELEIRFSTPVEASLETKALSVENGECFHNLLVLLTRDNKIMHKKIWTSDPDSYVSDIVVRVPDVEVGAYEVYAYANYDQEAWQDVTISSTELLAGPGDNYNPERRLKAISETMPTLPEPAAGKSMLLTGHTEVTVGVANNVGTVKLLRPVARLNVYLNNHTPYTIRLDRLVFNNFFANQAYLMGRENEEGVPLLPQGTALQALPAYDESAPKEVPAAEMRSCVYHTLMYEMAMSGGAPCRLYAKVSLENSDTSYPSMEMGSATEGSILKRLDNQTGQASLLTAIWRNQELNIEINVYYKTVSGVVDFRIDNTFWTEDGHVSSHTYDE
jgi:hypothetical protein